MPETSLTDTLIAICYRLSGQLTTLLMDDPAMLAIIFC